MKKPIASYDESDILDYELKYRKDNLEDFGYDESTSDDFIREGIYNDPEVFSITYKDACFNIGEAFIKKFKTLCAKVEGRNLDWLGSCGKMYICLEQLSEPEEIGKYLLNKIKPNTSDLTLTCYNTCNNGLQIIICHHDCPTGSQFYLTPCARSTYEKHK